MDKIHSILLAPPAYDYFPKFTFQTYKCLPPNRSRNHPTRLQRTAGRLPTPEPNCWTPDLPPPGEQPDWTMQPGEPQKDIGSLSAESRPAEYVDGSCRPQLPPAPGQPDPLSPVTAHEQERPELESGASGCGHVVSFEVTRSPLHRGERSAESPSWPEPEKTGHTEPWLTPAKQTPVTGQGSPYGRRNGAAPSGTPGSGEPTRGLSH